MATLLELRQMSDDKLEEMLENGHEEIFNLRFQRASGRLEDYSRLRIVRREMARLETLLHMRALAKEAALTRLEVAEVVADRKWNATAQFSYEDSAWLVEFFDEAGASLASAMVDLNQVWPKGRKQRRVKRPPTLVRSYTIAG